MAGVQLKLAPRVGTYPLTATWTPSDADDAGHYPGSVVPATVKLQAK